MQNPALLMLMMVSLLAESPLTAAEPEIQYNPALSVYEQNIGKTLGPQPPTTCLISVSPQSVTRGSVVDVELSYFPCYQRGERSELMTIKWPSTYEGYDATSFLNRSFPAPSSCVTSSVERIVVPLAESIQGVATVEINVPRICTASATLTILP
ncbi:MAG: hypothetical protein ACKO6N_11030 [Myxococcota bacterium]